MIEIKFKFPMLDELIKKNQGRVEMALAAAMQTNRALLFDAEGGAMGHKKWDPLKFRNGRPLMNRGTLRKSMGPTNDGKTPGRGPDGILQMRNSVVKIGTSLAYAAIHNSGGKVEAKNAKALKIPIPSGKKGLIKGEGSFMFRKSVVIPMRNFDSITEQDKKEFSDTIKNTLVEVLSGK